MALPTLYDNGFISVPWAEFVSKDGSHGASFASGWDQGNQATFNILVAWANGLQAEQDLLGVSYFDGTALHRTPPVRHPYKTDMRAERIISAHPVRWDGKFIQPMELYGNGASLDFGTMSGYDYWLLSVGFVKPKYRILDDTTLASGWGGGEWNRFCIVEQKPEYLTITREAGTWKWADSSVGPGYAGFTSSTPTNVAFNAPWGQTIVSWRISVLWKRVPRVGLFGYGGYSDFLNQNIETCAGKLHDGSVNLWDAPSNTYSSVLRFVNAHATPVESPFTPGAQGLNGEDPNVYYDVLTEWHWFDPPYGNSSYRGHNLAPSPGQIASSGTVVFDNKWYLVSNGGFNTTTGVPIGQGIFESTDLSQVFTLSLI